MARLISGFFSVTLILVLAGGILIPSPARAEDDHSRQHETAHSFDRFLDDLKGQARRAAAAAEAAGEQSKEALSGLKDRMATKAADIRNALSGQQWKWESFHRDSAATLDAWANATETWLERLRRSALAVIAKFGGREQAESRSTCPEIHV